MPQPHQEPSKFANAVIKEIDTHYETAGVFREHVISKHPDITSVGFFKLFPTKTLNRDTIPGAWARLNAEHWDPKAFKLYLRAKWPGLLRKRHDASAEGEIDGHKVMLATPIGSAPLSAGRRAPKPSAIFIVDKGSGNLIGNVSFNDTNVLMDLLEPRHPLAKSMIKTFFSKRFVRE